MFTQQQRNATFILVVALQQRFLFFSKQMPLDWERFKKVLESNKQHDEQQHNQLVTIIQQTEFLTEFLTELSMVKSNLSIDQHVA